ncbi:hypothetical protein ACIBHY_38465 [Nonomuraea sp. NPDC050547]|uniref:hypothetical protein n=1 Tax=Nonomuraea sp. NPDC050547 TaxID=3364368 RepID=UPI00378D9FCD
MSTHRTLDDRLIAPGATPRDRAVVYTSAVAGTVLATALAYGAGLSALPLVLIAIVAFDLYGGAAVNATTAAKRHFHRPGRTWRHHVGFVAIHVQPFLLALVVPGFTWTAAAVVYALALGGAVITVSVPSDVRRPVAFGCTALAIGLALPLAIPAAIGWLVPVLFVKLLLAHLQPL